jgi:hypothetical protein
MTVLYTAGASSGTTTRASATCTQTAAVATVGSNHVYGADVPVATTRGCSLRSVQARHVAVRSPSAQLGGGEPRTHPT